MKIIAITSLLVSALFQCESSGLQIAGTDTVNQKNCDLVNNASAGTDITIEGYTVTGFLAACRLAGYIS